MSVAKRIMWGTGEENRPEGTMTYDYIGVDVATEFLTRVHPDQRPVRPKNVKRLAGIIANGLWRPGASIIAIDRDNYLIQGQHRCQAILQTGIGVWSWVHRGVDPETFDAYDQELRRGLPDILNRDGYGNTVIVAAALSFMIRYEERTFEKGNARPTLPFHQQLLNTEVRSFANRRSLIKELSHSCSWRIPSIARAFTFAAFILFSSVDRGAALEFFNRFRDGVGLEKGSPILALRNHFVGIKILEKDRASNDMYFLLTLKAWNYWRTGKKIEKLAADKPPRTIREVN